MIERIIEWSSRNALLVLLVSAAAGVWGYWAATHASLDALPDLGEVQVIVYSRWDQAPQIVEDQLTYPLVTALMGAPRVKTVRGISDFGYSFVYVIFEDSVELYWARARVTEYLAGIREKLPRDASIELGPDASGLGWVYQYVLLDDSGQHSLADLRALQDWFIRYHLKSVSGVAEVASVGGFPTQYQVRLDPTKLRARGVSISQVVEAVQGGSSEVGGRLFEVSGHEYMIRGRGYARSAEDLGNLLVSSGDTPVRVRDVAEVGIGPDLRRGVSDLDGSGDVVSGIVIMRHGQNALEVIDAVKSKMDAIAPGLPPGVRLAGVYDRSLLIRSAIRNLKITIFEVILTVSLIILFFLRHFASALIPIVTILIAVLATFGPLQAMGMTANILSLGGIAIAVGALVDASIVVVEQAHKQLGQWHDSGQPGHASVVVVRAVKDVARPAFFALLILAVAFLPVLALEEQEGRLFRPLAATKTVCILAAAILAITLDPALRLLILRTEPFRFRPSWAARFMNRLVVSTGSDGQDRLNTWLIRKYEPVVRWSLRHSNVVLLSAGTLLVATVPAFLGAGTEFLPPLNEGTLLYMPSTVPGISITQAKELLQVTDRILKQFPEVDHVLGKAGRADTSTDPAPLSMLETIITLRPREEWRSRERWYSHWSPEWLLGLLRRVAPDRITLDELQAEMNAALSLPGIANAWTMPIRGRIDMLSTGIRTPLGLAIAGPDAAGIENLGKQVESALRGVPGTRNVFAERLNTGHYIDVDWERDNLARYQITLAEAQAAVRYGLGGEHVTSIIAGRARYPVSVRVPGDYRGSLADIEALPVSGTGARQIPIHLLAHTTVREAPTMLRNVDGMLTGYVYLDISGVDIASYIKRAAALLKVSVPLPTGYTLAWKGEFEAERRAQDRLWKIVPAAILITIILLYLSTRSWRRVALVAMAVPFSAIGAVWLVVLLGYKFSIGVWVGLIALLGLDAETGVFMLLYLDLAREQARLSGTLRTSAESDLVVLRGAAGRIRPKLMTVTAALIGLLPILWSDGTGSDLLRRIAAPMIGGLVTSFLLELLVYPVLYRKWFLGSTHSARAAQFS
jgi:copper/silver efflux system protein